MSAAYKFLIIPKQVRVGSQFYDYVPAQRKMAQGGQKTGDF